MTAWKYTQYIGSGLSLVAFIVAAIFYGYREWIRGRASIIRSAPQNDRLDAIATVAEFFRVDVSHLPTEQQANIVLEQLHMRSRRDYLFFWSFITIAFLCGSVALATIFVDGPKVPPIETHLESKIPAIQATQTQTVPPKSEAKATECDDPPARHAETDETRVSAFSYRVADNPNVSNWTRSKSDHWIEKNHEGENVFLIQRRARIGVCDGTVIADSGENSLQLLVSDKNCPTKALLFRRLPPCDWHRLSKMEDVR